MLDLGDRTSIYQPEQKGLIFPEIPEFETIEEERQYRKERLVAADLIVADHHAGRLIGGSDRIED